MNKPGFLNSLREFDKDNVEEKLVLDLGKFLKAEENQNLLS